ncbi:MAG: hypothetical protein AB7O62_08995 [Pirellulales bacterium]
MQTSCLFIGDRAHGEFVAAANDLEAHATSRFADSVEAAVRLLATEDEEPALAIVARIRPGDISARQIERLRRAAPLARIVELLGTWCDGELRSGQPLTATIRVPCHLWPVWFRREVRDTSHPGWPGPVTASAEERLLDHAAATPHRTGLIVIRGCDTDGAAWLAQVCRHAGYATAGLESTPSGRIAGVTAGIWQAGIRYEQHWSDLRTLIAAVAPAPVVCSLGFPRPEEIDRAIALGARQVLAQPLLVEDLLASLQAE